MHRVVLIDGEPYRLDDRYDVTERYRFGRETAALVDLDEDEAVDDEAVVAQDPAFDIYPRLVGEEYDGTDDPVATLDDVRTVSDVPTRGTTGEGVHAVVMDSGIDTDHPAFEGADVNQVDVTGTGTGDRLGHGTATAGQFRRLAPGADLTSLKIFPDSGKTGTRYILRAYQWLFENADSIDLVNMSWGGSRVVPTLDRLQNRLVARGVRDVTAAGNSGGHGGSPATAERAFSVGACTQRGAMAPFSSYDPTRDNPDVVAVGVRDRLARADRARVGTPLSEEWLVASGTSFAAPAVAGMAARYLERSDASPGRLREDFVLHARNVEGTPRDAHGIADYDDTIDC